MNRSGPDWAGLIAPVAERLLGKPTRKTAREWRFGSKGSLAVHVGGSRAGRWRDFQADEGGGVLTLIQRERGCDKAGAVRWLEREGLLEGKSPKTPPEPLRAPETARPMPDHGVSGENRPSEAHGRASPAPRSKTTEIARRIVEGSVGAKETPAARYLAGRMAWPPEGIGPDLPDTVRWITGGEAPANLPPDAAGAVVYRYTGDGVKVEALTPDGRRTAPRFRRNYGSLSGQHFEAAFTPGGELWLVEGEVDALSLAAVGLGGIVRAVGGAGGFKLESVTDPERRTVVVFQDGDAPGGRAGWDLQDELRRLGRECHVIPLSGGDAADLVKEHIDEKAALVEEGSSASAMDATRRTWKALLAAIAQGRRPFDPLTWTEPNPPLRLNRTVTRNPWWEVPTELPDLTPYRPRPWRTNAGGDRRWGGQIERDWRRGS